MDRLTKLLCALAAMAASMGAFAVEVTSDQAQTAVRNWIRKNPRPMTAQFATGNGEAKTFAKDGKTLFHVVELEGGGFVVTSGDTRISPIVAFSENGAFSHDKRNPLLDLLMSDMVFRQSELSAYGSASTSARLMAASAEASQPIPDGQSRTANENAWEELLTTSTARPQLLSVASLSQLSDVRVEPLLKTEWDQSTWGNYSNTPDTFNYHTPQRMVCGCVATAGAQIMKRWEYPKSSIAASEFDCTVNRTPQRLKMKGGTYDWASMTEAFSEQNWNLPEINCEAIGRLTYDVGVASHMNYTDTDSGSGTQTDMMVEALKTVFKYKMSYVKDCQIYKGTSLTDEIKAAIYGSLDAGMPVSASIRRPNGKSSGGHSVVFDGYGYVGNTLYTHINCGWAQGGENVWYDVMGEGLTTSHRFYLLNLVGYNIHPTKTGDVISGRVLSTDGMAVSDATVSISRQGQVVDTMTTNERGIWFFFVADLGTYDVSAVKGTRKSKHFSVEHQKASQTATYTTLQTGEYKNTNAGFCGNKWGVDLTLESESEVVPDDPVVEQVAAPVFSPAEGTFTTASTQIKLSCGTSGATIYYTMNGSTPSPSSTRYTGAVTISSTTTFKAIAVKSGMADSDVVNKTYTKVVVKPTIGVGEALDDTARTYTASDDTMVVGQDEVTHDGVDALKLSCPKTSGAKTSVTATFSGAGTLSFWWCDPSATPRYSPTDMSIVSYDSYFYCTVKKTDGTEYGSWKCGALGSAPWEKCEIPLPAGTYTVEWSVSAGNAMFAAARTSYVDEVLFVPYPGGSRNVLFDANGADGGTPEQSAVAAEFGDRVVLPGAGTLSRSGFVFRGWACDPDAQMAEYAPGNSICVGASDMRFYAVWNKLIAVLLEIPQAGGSVSKSIDCYGKTIAPYAFTPDWAGEVVITGTASTGGTTEFHLSNAVLTIENFPDLAISFSAVANDGAEDRHFDVYVLAFDYPYVIDFHVVQKADVMTDKPKGLVIDGASSVVSSSGAAFSSQVVRRNGSVNEVSPTWSVVSGGSYASVSSSGQLTAQGVSSPQTVVLRASYEEDGIECSTEQKVTILPTCDLNTALDNNSLAFQTGTGGNAWFGQSDVSCDGVDAARASSAMGGTPWIKTVVDGPALISFDCMMSASPGNVLYFVDNGKTNECAFSVPMTIPAWQRKRFFLAGEGPHNVEFVYAHDGGISGAAGDDAAWIDNVVTNPVQGSVCEISLAQTGWHLVSFSALPADPSPASVFGDELAKVGSLADMGSLLWTPSYATLTELTVGEPYWINTTAPNLNLSVVGMSDPGREFRVKKGYNRIGYTLANSGNTADVLKTALDSGAITYVADDGSLFYPGGGLETMSPGKVYWVYAPVACTIRYDVE